MAKYTVEMNSEEFDYYMKNRSSATILHNFALWIRGQVKYHDDNCELCLMTLEEVKEQFFKECTDENYDPLV